ncbi:hypothetical protein GOBAR_AA00825 [Gossypium barbadense]|uniref:Uncharacterized protein n=1 Tax=Gossypium barbadense TaxID=3634 RepID=A0A2P5YW18_GOSBA|nr:hypothetical protein GOBAR_AA00825 [Gossypium barbadense]
MVMLVKIPNRFEGGRISINWLEKIFDKLPDDATEEVIQQYARAFIMRWNHGLSYVGMPDELDDVRLLLDQRLETKFEWMSYADPEIISFLSKMLDNRKMRGCGRTISSSSAPEEDTPSVATQYLGDLSGHETGPYLAPTQTACWTQVATSSHLGRVGIQDSTYCECTVVDKCH